MVGPGGDFEDGPDDEPVRPLLPPEDRIWRHPSELAIHGPPPIAETLEARRKWMVTTPSRAGAWSAGMVGAILATGVVLVGTHMTAWLNRAPNTSRPATAGVHAAFVTATSLPQLGTPQIEGMVATISAALVRVRAISAKGATTGDGVVISSNGLILAPSSMMAGATSIRVLPSDGEELAAHLVGRDPETGIALIGVNASGLTSLPLSEARPRSTESFALLAWRQETGIDLSLGRLDIDDRQTAIGHGPALLQSCPASLGLARAPLGTLLIGGDGTVSGIVSSHGRNVIIETPGWVAAHVVTQLIEHGRVEHGWLGISGATATRTTTIKPGGKPGGSSSPGSGSDASVAGVRVLSVQPKSAAARAGIRRGDIIASVNGHRVATMSDLEADLYLMAPSAPVRLGIVRGKQLDQMSTHLQSAA